MQSNMIANPYVMCMTCAVTLSIIHKKEGPKPGGTSEFALAADCY